MQVSRAYIPTNYKYQPSPEFDRLLLAVTGLCVYAPDALTLGEFTLTHLVQAIQSIPDQHSDLRDLLLSLLP
jgi:hypothetical protein